LWQKSVEPRKVETKVWSVARSGRLHKMVKSMEPYVVAKKVWSLEKWKQKCGAQKSGKQKCGVWLEVVGFTRW
jgi:hypothetical protein